MPGYTWVFMVDVVASNGRQAYVNKMEGPWVPILSPPCYHRDLLVMLSSSCKFLSCLCSGNRALNDFELVLSPEE